MTDSTARPVVVTGGRGRIGRHLVERLRRRGDRVVSIARLHSDVPHPDDVRADVTDADAVEEAIARSGADVVVHLASVLRGDGIEDVNARIDRTLAEAIRRCGAQRVVHASSGAVYGVTAESARQEDSPLEGSGPYARSKIRAEEIFGGLAADGDAASVTSLRIFNVAGPAFPDSLVHRLIHASASQPVMLTAPDRFIRDYIHQDDLVDVLCAAIDHSTTGARVVNVGAGVAVSTRTLLERIAPDPSAVVESPGEPSFNWADISAMTRLFGVRPRAVPDRTWD
ncbi:NAD-dependent epimerase/dehydratase family protein [Agromyces sp. GXQ0307]|uniref:NAD-dependent epimerase/dehydratase family protein n=1 Tax=Agromyces sp. GXQ0307 TaxID=3377835 RepID=UPI003839FF5E